MQNPLGVVFCVTMAAASLVAQTAPVSPTPGSVVGDALDLYSRGEHAAAISRSDVRHLLLGAVIAGADGWIAAGDPSARLRREQVASAFGLDLIWATTRNSRNAVADGSDPVYGLMTPLQYPWQKLGLSDPKSEFWVVAWGCRLMPLSGPPSVAERSWWLASVGLLEDSYAWHELIGTGEAQISSTTLNGQSDSGIMRERFQGHLAHARRRFPDEPRLRLAQVVAQTAIDLYPRYNWLQDRPDVLRDDGDHLHHFLPKRVPESVRAFEALKTDPSLAGEAELHIGYLELRRRQWAAAIQHFDNAGELVATPLLQAQASYLAGWTHERLGHTAESIAGYRRALALAPGMRNVSTLLAAELFLTNQRAEAYTILKAGLTAEPAPFDLLTMFERGDASLVPMYIVKMREAWR
jgi:tetratricopeptide (TPR) repeat protein